LCKLNWEGVNGDVRVESVKDKATETNIAGTKLQMEQYQPSK